MRISSTSDVSRARCLPPRLDAEQALDAPLTTLAGTGMADRFRLWSGGSGRRYVFSVFPLGGFGWSDADLPPGDAVVIAVQRASDGARLARFVAETGSCPDLFYGSHRVRSLLGRTGWELHLHLTAGDRSERRSIVADLEACCSRVDRGCLEDRRVDEAA